MQRTRIMPANHWDWSMPVKFSQGWAIDGPVRWIFVGVVRSAPTSTGARSASATSLVQTRNVFENIRTVLAEAGATIGRHREAQYLLRVRGQRR